jgi:hypothetical protein
VYFFDMEMCLETFIVKNLQINQNK